MERLLVFPFGSGRPFSSRSTAALFSHGPTTIATQPGTLLLYGVYRAYESGWFIEIHKQNVCTTGSDWPSLSALDVERRSHGNFCQTSRVGARTYF